MRYLFTKMQLFVCSLLIITLILSCKKEVDDPYSSPEDYTRLVWSDEFDSTSLSTARWNYQVGPNWQNEELQAYTNNPENIYVENGSLVIQAKNEPITLSGVTKQYSSARITTRNKGDWKYGKIEVRAKLPKGKGIWPAIWMMPTDDVYGGWPQSGEIDIMELKGSAPYVTQGTIHYGPGPSSIHISDYFELEKGDFSDDYHVFSILWEKDLIRWYVDGKMFFYVEPKTIAPEKYVFNERFHLILNCAVGGWFDGNPDETTQFPQKMYVDYVRVYQKP
ncbi:MAG TPA: glycoside hydrolase family 16 protein [Cytophagaceae bacterium]